jgi:cholesterol oxidase
MAYRLADAGRDVCVLERGKKWPPGSFPRTPYQLSQAEWDPDKKLYGLLDVWSFKGLGALVSSGLGGGSLIYANVLLRKDEKWFVEAPPDGLVWPITRADLERHYDEVERVLQPVPYPQHLWNRTPKTLAFRAAAEAAGHEPEAAPLAVTFSRGDELGIPFDSPGDNLHRVQRYGCRLTGECDVGCNFGSKNTTDLTYLSMAKKAEIRTLHEVKTFEPSAGGGFRIEVADHSEAAEHGGPSVERVIHARTLILAAGALGSPYLLLKNRDAFPALSDRLGTRFSANGDFLAFASRCETLIEPAVGPVVTSYIRIPDQLDDPPGAGRGHYIQDGGYGAFLAWVQETLAMPSIAWSRRKLLLKLAWRSLTGRRERNLSYELSQLLGDPDRSAGTLTMLGMGREPVQGTMQLKRKRLDIDWSFETARSYFDELGRDGAMAELADELGGRFHDNVLRRLNAIVTAHPLGGCPMGLTDADGVVSPTTGQVHNYPGLHVADGSVMPGPIGPNPSFTIAAVANRFADGIIAETMVTPA